MCSWGVCGCCVAHGGESARKAKNHSVSAECYAVRGFDLIMYRQVQPRVSDGQYKGVWRSLVRMWNEEGFKGFMRGNGINCLRIVPYR